MAFLFWILFAFCALFMVSLMGLSGFIGLMIFYVVFYALSMILWEEMAANKNFRRKVLKGIGILILVAAVAFPIWHVTCNVVYNRYELNFSFAEWIPSEYDDRAASIRDEKFEKCFLARNDSIAVERSRSYVLKKARKWFSTSPKPVRISVYPHLYNKSKGYFEHVSCSDSLSEKLHSEICTYLDIVEIEERSPYTIVNTSKDSLEEDSL